MSTSTDSEKRKNADARSKLATLQAVAVSLLIACVAVVVLFFVCWLGFKEDRPSFGIANEDAGRIAAVYGPVVLITFTGFRDSFNTLWGSVGGVKTIDWIYFDKVGGAVFQYILVVLGFGSALLALLLVSAHASPIPAEGLIGVAAGIWAVTAGEVFRRYLRAYVSDRPA